MARVLAIDWSGDLRAPERKIRVAEAIDGELVDVRPGLRAPEMARHLSALADDGPLVVGLDFAFGFPEWFARERLEAHTVDDVWAAAERDGEEWLAACEPPFWGRPGRKRPPLDAARPQLRRTDTRPGLRPKSIFQVGGSGAVGTGSIRGMPLLRRLRESGFQVWPFDGAGPRLVVEIYPRALTGPVVKSDPAARRAYIAQDGRVPGALVDAVTASEDAFDAAISALEMSRHVREFARLRAETGYIVEGAIWLP
jgi:hypothetical protein